LNACLFSEVLKSFPADDQSIRQLVVWLEDHKIRHYKIEDRSALKQIKDEKWPNVFKKYLNDLKCPHPPQALHSVIDWLLGLAVQLEYGENGDLISLLLLIIM
jgi:RLL motif-containing protein 1